MRGGRLGMTLVETLASVALCGMLLAALGSMASGLARSSREIERLHHWEMCAEAMLRAMHDEIASGWRPDAADPGRGARVTSSGEGVRIVVRAAHVGSETTVLYVLVRGTGGLEGGVIERHVVSPTSGRLESTVLGDVGDFGCALHGDAVEVRVSSAMGGERTRRIRLAGGGAM